jgi:hypothetical protein
MTWRPLPAHAVLMLRGVGAHVLGGTHEMHSPLPSAGISAGATNSVESRLCGHNVQQLITCIHDAMRGRAGSEEQANTVKRFHHAAMHEYEKRCSSV